MPMLDFSLFRASKNLFSGTGESVLRGQSMEFLELAEYDGQSAKHIDWNASVRSGKTKVRHYAADHDVRVWILSDIGATFGFGCK